MAMLDFPLPGGPAMAIFDSQFSGIEISFLPSRPKTNPFAFLQLISGKLEVSNLCGSAFSK